MADKYPRPPKPARGALDANKLDKIVAEARRGYAERMEGYRAQALKLYPWVCGRCGRTFDRINLHELTVHHRDHDHDNNPPDGSNWELLCRYCHDNEHARHADLVRGEGVSLKHEETAAATHRPFSALKDLLKPGAR